MKFINYVRTPLPPFHWVLSLSRGWSKFNSVVKYYPFGKKGEDDLPANFSADQTASTKRDPSLLVRHPLDPKPNVATSNKCIRQRLNVTQWHAKIMMKFPKAVRG